MPCHMLLPSELASMQHQQLPEHVEACRARIAARVGAVSWNLLQCS